MPKIQEYEELTSTDITDNHLFITEQKNTTSTTYPTKIVSFKNLWKKVWFQIMNYIEGDGVNSWIDKNWTDLQIKIRGHRIEPWAHKVNATNPSTTYYGGDLVWGSGLNTSGTAWYRCAIDMGTSYTSYGNWEAEKSNWSLVTAFADYITIYIYPSNWSDTAPYTCTSNSYNERINEYSSVIMDFCEDEYNDTPRELQVDSYNCIDKISVDVENKLWVFTCYNKKPTHQFKVKLHITYNDSNKDQNDMFIMHRASGNVIDDNIIESDTKTWSTKKIMEVISAFTDTNKVEVFNLPETGTAGIIYQPLSDEEGFIKCNSTQNYGEYIWLNSENKYTHLGDYTDLLVLVNTLPDSGVGDISYLNKNDNESTQYNKSIWNDVTQSYEVTNSLDITTDIPTITEAPLTYNSRITTGQENIIYKEYDYGNTMITHSIWDSTTSKLVTIGTSTPTETDTAPEVAITPTLPTISGVENLIYCIQGHKCYIWQEDIYSFVFVGIGNNMYQYRSYKVVASLPNTSSVNPYSYVYRIVNTEDTSQYKEYVCNNAKYSSGVYNCTYTFIGISNIS